MRLDDQAIRVALARTGERLKIHRDVDIVLIGGAAAVLTGQLPAAWATGDVDLFQCRHPADRDAVMEAAAQAARELSLPPSWISEDAGLFAWTVPENWRRRRVEVGVFGKLRVYAVGRLDLIVTKFVAHREGDLEHLREMRLSADEVGQARGQLLKLLKRHPEEVARIDMAIQYADHWEAAK